MKPRSKSPRTSAGHHAVTWNTCCAEVRYLWWPSIHPSFPWTSFTSSWLGFWWMPSLWAAPLHYSGFSLDWRPGRQVTTNASGRRQHLQLLVAISVSKAEISTWGPSRIPYHFATVSVRLRFINYRLHGFLVSWLLRVVASSPSVHN